MEHLNAVVIFLALAVLLGGMEIFIPSLGLLTLCALAALGGSLWHAAAIGGGFLIGYVVFLLFFVPILVVFLLKIAPKTPFGKKVFLETPVESPESADPIRREFRTLVGQTGRAVSRMMPGGRVEISGKFYDAVSDSGAVDPGGAVTVVRFEAATLIVRSNLPTESSSKNPLS